MRAEYLVAEVAATARGQVRVQDGLDVERDAVRERDLAVGRADRLERRERGRACSARAHAVKLRRRRDTRRRQEVELGVALALVNGRLVGEREQAEHFGGWAFGGAGRGGEGGDSGDEDGGELHSGL